MYGPSPQDELDRQKALTAKYKQDLSLTVQENRKLHAIIIKSVQESDPYDDSHFSTNFAALEDKIFHLVKKHFSANGAITGWYEYDSVKESDDRDFFLQAHIATATAQALFSHEERLFGLDERTDRHLAAFETLLQDSHSEHRRQLYPESLTRSEPTNQS